MPMYQPEIETMPQDQLRALQSERLVAQVHHVYNNVPYYRAKMEEKGVTPNDIHGVEDLHKLPFISKSDLREAYPYGLLGTPLSECVRIQSTSGTTGRRVVAFYTQHDIDLWEDCCARAIMAAGGTKDDVVHVSYGYGLFTGGAGASRRLPQGGQPDAAHVLGQHRPADPVHVRPGLHHPLLHPLLCRLPGRERPGAGPEGPDQAQGRHLRRRGLDRGDAPGHSRTSWASRPMTSTA